MTNRRYILCVCVCVCVCVEGGLLLSFREQRYTLWNRYILYVREIYVVRERYTLSDSYIGCGTGLCIVGHEVIIYVMRRWYRVWYSDIHCGAVIHVVGHEYKVCYRVIHRGRETCVEGELCMLWDSHSVVISWSSHYLDPGWAPVAMGRTWGILLKKDPEWRKISGSRDLLRILGNTNFVCGME